MAPTRVEGFEQDVGGAHQVEMSPQDVELTKTDA